ncbi:5-methyltetrahydropteroyltriglutamate--homocysteine methyltransferase [Frankliniella fusca]|uniref:5-methyltetrahydropteroyltriglutamate--homocysteine methyltransferase n=1 Tax=Frankliniella fusca TaxID=407009 RepID=A0AAE1LRE8_9NEOP|nr:5-methyltetrahydropteroyltriglutamate--homocysteine methyltransferase [Frankliniella fusca]
MDMILMQLLSYIVSLHAGGYYIIYAFRFIALDEGKKERFWGKASTLLYQSVHDKFREDRTESSSRSELFSSKPVLQCVLQVAAVAALLLTWTCEAATVTRPRVHKSYSSQELEFTIANSHKSYSSQELEFTRAKSHKS